VGWCEFYFNPTPSGLIRATFICSPSTRRPYQKKIVRRRFPERGESSIKVLDK